MQHVSYLYSTIISITFTIYISVAICDITFLSSSCIIYIKSFQTPLQSVYSMFHNVIMILKNLLIFFYRICTRNEFNSQLGVLWSNLRERYDSPRFKIDIVRSHVFRYDRHGKPRVTFSLYILTTKKSLSNAK